MCTRFAQGAHLGGAHGPEFPVGHGEDDGIVGAGGGLGHRRDAVFVLGLGSAHPGVVHIGLYVVFGQLAHDIDHTCVAQIGAVFLEGQAQHQHASTLHVHAALGHALHQLGHHIGAHAVVEAAPGQDDFRVVADGLGLVGEVVRVYANAVPAHQAGAKRQEVPLGAGGLQHGLGVDAHAVEDHGQLVDQGNVHIALGVFNHLGGFGHADARGLVRAGGDDAGVERVHLGGHLGGRAAGDLFDGGHPVFFVAGVDALGAVAGKEVHIEDQA